MTNDLILASASATRAKLLAAAGVAFRVEPAAIDENSLKRIYLTERRSAGDCALALAGAKAGWVSERHRHALVIGADQILVCNSVWFDKPSDLCEARSQLQTLRGRSHELVTAVCAVQAGTQLWHNLSRSQLKMREFSDNFLDYYIAAEGETLLGTVGAYRLEGRGVQLFEHIDGDHFAILGLSLVKLLGFLRDRGEIAS
jgi:septum formation protein